MELIFIHGPPASGKLTVARALEALTGLPVFHNHLIVDALSPLFEFGSEPFVGLREAIWLSIFSEAAAAGRSFIFTFAPERTVRPTFVDHTQRLIEARGGAVRFVALTASPRVLEARIEDDSRARYGKLRSRALLKDLTAAGAFDTPSPPAALTLDTEMLTPEAAAEQIAAAFHLKRVG